MTQHVWKGLTGMLCVYKHAGTSTTAMKKFVINSIVDSIADIESTSSLCLPLISLPLVQPHEKSGALVVVGKEDIPDYRYHHLVSGKSIRSEDIHIHDLYPTDSNSSGVCVFAMNSVDDLKTIELTSSWTNKYRIDGILGESSKSESTDPVDVSRISRHRFEKTISRLESEFRSESFLNAGVDMQSEEAFEMARKGIVKSNLPGAMTILSIQTNWFKIPRFSITIQCSGEDEKSLRSIIESIGNNIGTGAFPVKIRRLSIGPFNENNALLEKNLSLQNILRNIALNRKLLENPKNTEYEKKEIFDGLGTKELLEKNKDFDSMRPSWPRNY